MLDTKNNFMIMISFFWLKPFWKITSQFLLQASSPVTQYKFKMVEKSNSQSEAQTKLRSKMAKGATANQRALNLF